MAHAWLADRLARRTGAESVMPLYPLTPHHMWEEVHRPMLDLYRRTVSESPGKRIILVHPMFPIPEGHRTRRVLARLITGELA